MTIKKIYDHLPSIYRLSDSQIDGEPLKRFLSIFDIAVESLEESARKSSLAMFPMQCMPSQLNDVFASYGFTFHNEMTEFQKRRILKALPFILKDGGGDKAFEVLGKELFGSSTAIAVTKPDYVEGMLPEEYRRLVISLSVDGNNPLLNTMDTKTTKAMYEFMAEQFRPVNYAIMLMDSVFFSEVKNKTIIQEIMTNKHAVKIDVLPYRIFVDYNIETPVGVTDYVVWAEHIEIMTNRNEIDLSQEANSMIAI